MSLRDVDIKIEYRTMVDNMAHDFYIPLLNEAIEYKRAVGFFSSSVLTEISKGISGLVKNGGRIRLIASPKLSDEDIEAIRLGYEEREKIVHDALCRELKEPINEFQAKQLNYLANLIAESVLDIRIAITESSFKTGMYHEKMGIITDSCGNKVAFSGSMNETANALLANYETIDVFKNWKDEEGRVNTKEEAFDSIWDNIEPGVRIIEIKDLSKEIVEKYKSEKVNIKEYQLNYSAEDVSVDITDNSFFRLPFDLSLYDYQKKAITKWMEKNACGIFDMATGTGKTYTALAALSSLSMGLNNNIAVIIVVPYRHLVEQWIEDIRRFGVNPVVAYSYKGQKWRSEFKDSIEAYNCDAIKHFCIITTNATFSGNDFQNILGRFRKNFCFVVDEAHNFGAKKLSKMLPKKARYRLALSATIERHRDEEGTRALKSYFGAEPCISFSLKDAINNGFLTPYYYHPIVVHLNDEELAKYNELTQKIIRIAGFDANIQDDNSALDLLLIKRARIIAGCKEKIDKLIEVISDEQNSYNILIYCGATKYDRDDIDDLDDVKQIDEVNRRLYEDLHMKVRKFTSMEDMNERIEIIEMFLNHDIQVITAIKCLDEGVNIPAIEKAYILASSTNPKEYIQRRGRVLRKYPGKDYAEIYDFITLPRKLEDVKYLTEEERKYDLTLAQREFSRMIDFANTARNPSEIDLLMRQISDTYKIQKSFFDEQ